MLTKSSLIAAAALVMLALATTASGVDGPHVDTGRGLASALPPAATASRALRLEEFSSPDRKIECAIDGLPPAVICSSVGTPEERAILRAQPGVTVSVCHKVRVRGGCCPASVSCIFNYFVTSVPILHYGQTTDLLGRCTSAVDGITCTGAGKGFRINTHESVVVNESAAHAPSVGLTPTFGHTAILRTISGTILVERPGASAFVPLSTLTSVPLGTTIDTTNGTVQLTSATSPKGGTQTGQFYSGIFKVTQTKARSPLKGGRSVGFTDLSLTGGTPSGCASGARASTSSTHEVRRLWGNAHGNFRTAGRYASATVRGTKWLTEDTCTGTLVKVARGIVAVQDLRTGKTVLVRAGRSFLSGSGVASASSALLWTALTPNLTCGIASTTPEVLLCIARSTTIAASVPVSLGSTGPSTYDAAGLQLAAPSGTPPVALESGQKWERAALGVACSVTATAVRCSNRSNDGFRIKEEGKGLILEKLNP